MGHLMLSIERNLRVKCINFDNNGGKLQDNSLLRNILLMCITSLSKSCSNGPEPLRLQGYLGLCFPGNFTDKLPSKELSRAALSGDFLCISTAPKFRNFLIRTNTDWAYFDSLLTQCAFP